MHERFPASSSVCYREIVIHSFHILFCLLAIMKYCQFLFSFSTALKLASYNSIASLPWFLLIYYGWSIERINEKFYLCQEVFFFYYYGSAVRFGNNHVAIILELCCEVFMKMCRVLKMSPTHWKEHGQAWVIFSWPE